VGDLAAVTIVDDQGRVPGRVCAIKKEPLGGGTRARQRTQRENSKKGHLVRRSTLQAASYIFKVEPVILRDAKPP
jgi:hypothetical protein